MQTQTNSPDGYILELYRHGAEAPVYVSVFSETTDAGFQEYSEDKADAVIFESREALLPLAAIEVEAILMEGEDEHSVFDGFRILPYTGKTTARLVTREELESALHAFEQGE